MKVLLLSRWLPYPPDNGSKLRIWNILQHLGSRHEVALISFADRSDRLDEVVLAELRRACARLRVLTYPQPSCDPLHVVMRWASPTPSYLATVFREEVAQVVLQESSLFAPDVVVVSQLPMVPYGLVLPGVPKVLEELELGAFRQTMVIGAPGRRWRAKLTWWKLAGYLRRVLPSFGVCTVASEPERALLAQVAPWYSDVAVVPNGLDLRRYEGRFGDPLPDSLIFSGALTYSANHDGYRYFVREVFPLVLQQSPRAVLRVTGQHPPLAEADLCPRVEFTGYLEDVRAAIARSWVSVVPLRQGGGTRLKILESMALGTPVVATPKGAEGLTVTDGHDILVADGPVAFARAVLRLLHSRELREHIARQGRRLVERAYDWQAIGRQLCDLVEATGRVHQRATGGGR